VDHEIRVVPSVFDRLIDDDRENTRDELPTRAESVRRYRLAVLRDLDNLLNARDGFADLFRARPGYVEAPQSVIAYGLRENTDLAIATPQGQTQLRQRLERAIRTFEPRLTNVTVTLPDADTQADGRKPMSLRLRIEARLLMFPSPDQVSFDVVMALDSGRYEVKDRG
jgi:type VI secretion system protein ImpF